MHKFVSLSIKDIIKKDITFFVFIKYIVYA